MSNLENHPKQEVSTVKELPNLLSDFLEIYKTKNLLKKEYLLINKAKNSNWSLEDYRRMFDLYCEVKRQSHLTYYLKYLIQIIQACGFIAIIFTAINFYWGAADRQRKHLFENWDVIALNNNSDKTIITVNRGRKEALEYLHDHNEDLSRVQAQGAVLNGLNLPGRARLQQSDFQGAMLFRAYLSGANLWSVVFDTANLDTVNFKGANLQFVDFKNADLQKACLREAKLDNAIFNAKTNLDKVDFRGATGLDLDAIKKAKNYQTAIYDKQVNLQLGLPVKNVADNVSEGCLVTPRTKNWWIKF
ncbi:hypothetical protein BCD64_20935 [Nostoc sp. MBR 210]|nr:hypothetical protein BCD64_20935 [Nostoc sp. MBR 210]